METKNTVTTIAAVALCLVLAVAVAILAGALFAPRLSGGEDAKLTQAINTAAVGNAGYEDITGKHITDGEKGVSIYLVKSGTGGKDLYCVFTTAKSHGCTVETLTAFSADGIIMSVSLLDVKGGIYNAKQLIEESGMLSVFGGVSYDSDSITLDGVDGTGSCDSAVIASVNKACETIKKVLYVEEEVSK